VLRETSVTKENFQRLLAGGGVAFAHRCEVITQHIFELPGVIHDPAPLAQIARSKSGALVPIGRRSQREIERIAISSCD
jgi:hypothetical protein